MNKEEITETPIKILQAAACLWAGIILIKEVFKEELE